METEPPTPSTPGLRAARAVARWELGDEDWADRIVHAYLNPLDAMENLRAEIEE